MSLFSRSRIWCAGLPVPAAAPLALLALAGLGGCASEAPFALYDYRYHQRGSVAICYSDSASTPELVRQTADEICSRYDRMAKFNYQTQYQCSWTAPSIAYFSCVPRPGENPRPVMQKNAPLRHDSTLGD